MGRLLLLASVPLLVAGAVLAQDRAPPDPADAVPRDWLPVLGTVGDLPPEKERVIVAVTTAGQVVVDGRSMDLNGLRQVLRERADRLREDDPPRLSRLHVVVRTDRRVPWRNLQWVMQTCADPSVRIYRILFAAVPREGEEGAMALFLSVGTGPPREGIGAARAAPLPVKVKDAPADADPAPSLFAHLARTFPDPKDQPEEAVVDADPRVAGGAVLQVVDALFRRGVTAVTLKGTVLNKDGKLMEAATAAPARFTVVLYGTTVGAPLPEDRIFPGAARVMGRMAGQTTPPPAETWILETPPVDEGQEIVDYGEEGTPSAAYALRGSAAAVLKREGAEDAATPVEMGLDWLARHQSEGGSWDADGFVARCGKDRCGGPGGPLYDPGVTGLALLAFLGRGETHRTPGHGAAVRNGLRYLKSIQDAEGCFGPRLSAHFTYNHAIATAAMAEAYGMTRSPLFKASAQDAVDFALLCRNPYLGWRYGVKPQDNDSSVTTWMVSALHAAREAGLDVEDEAFRGAVALLDKLTDPATGRIGYTFRGNGPARPRDVMDRFPANRTESLTAMGSWTRLLGGVKPGDPLLRKGLDLCLALPPKWSTSGGDIDSCYWLFGSLALHRAGGQDWTRWSREMRKALLQGQRREPGDHRRGSWDPVDPWASEGGRVYATATAVLTLETWYRYGR